MYALGSAVGAIDTVPAQALHLYNSPLVVEQANCFAQLVMNEKKERSDRVSYAYLRALHREPHDDELKSAMELVRLAESELKSEEKAWASLCQALLVTNEFRYVD